jgi:hypothetical protein
VKRRSFGALAVSAEVEKTLAARGIVELDAVIAFP